jgi:energy-coupling factor transporter ATP-binding protein EcfA2
MTMIKLSDDQRSMMRKALLENAIRTRGMDDEQIKAKFDELGPQRDLDPEVDDLHPGEDKPAPEGQPEQGKPEGEAKPAKRQRKRKASKGEGQPEQGEGEQGEGEQGQQGQPEQGEGEQEQEQEQEQKPENETMEQIVTRIAKREIAEAGLNGAGEIDEQAIIDLINANNEREARIVYDCIIKKGEDDEIKVENAHPLLGELVDVITAQENAYLVGPAGSGKTTLAASAAQALDVDFHFTGAISDKFELIGFVDAGGHYHETSFYRACVNGGVFLMDEMDSSIPSACNFINAALENGYVAFPNGETVLIDKDKSFFIGAGNTIGKGPDRQYVGRYPLDEAFLDRFEQLDIEYDNDIEMRMAESAWLSVGGDADQIENARVWAREVQAFRKLLDDRRIVAMVSPRATRRGAKWLAKGWKIERVREGMYKHLNDDILASLGVSR